MKTEDLKESTFPYRLSNCSTVGILFTGFSAGLLREPDSKLLWLEITAGIYFILLVSVTCTISSDSGGCQYHGFF